jgi:transmembrane protein EpsG
MFSVLIYLIIFSTSSLIFAYGIKRNFKIAIAIGLFIPVVLSALRYDVGTDYQSYIRIYDLLSGISFKEYLADNFGIEIGSYLIIKFANLFNQPINVMFGISSFLTIIFFYFGLKNYEIKNQALSYFLFLTILFPQSFNAVRQYIAIAIVFYAFSFIYKNKLLKFIALILIASAFHLSAILLLPIYFIKYLAKSTKPASYLNLLKILALFLIIIISMPLIINYISNLELFSRYSDYKEVINKGNNYLFYLKGLVYLVLLLFYKQINSSNPKYLFLYIFATLDFAFASIGFIAPMISRIGLYFSLFPLVLLSILPSLFKDRLGVFVSYIAIILYGLLYFIVIYYSKGYSDIFPYDWRLL